MNQTETILDQLRDVQLPPAPEGVSTGLLLANLLILLLIASGLYRHYRRGREQWRRDALFEVSQARSRKPAAAILSLAKLLKQILLHRQQDIANNAQRWLEDLDGAFATHWFTQEEGQIFGSALYQPVCISQEELQSLCTHLEKLIRQLPATPRRNASPQIRQHNTQQDSQQDSQTLP